MTHCKYFNQNFPIVHTPISHNGGRTAGIGNGKEGDMKSESWDAVTLRKRSTLFGGAPSAWGRREDFGSVHGTKLEEALSVGGKRKAEDEERKNGRKKERQKWRAREWLEERTRNSDSTGQDITVSFGVIVPLCCTNPHFRKVWLSGGC